MSNFFFRAFAGVPGTLRIADRDYTDELADKTSTQYLELFNELRPVVSCERTCCAIISRRSLRRHVSLAYFTSDLKHTKKAIFVFSDLEHRSVNAELDARVCGRHDVQRRKCHGRLHNSRD